MIGEPILFCAEMTLGGAWTALVLCGTCCKGLHQPLLLLSYSSEQKSSDIQFPGASFTTKLLFVPSDTEQFAFVMIPAFFLVFHKNCLIFHCFPCKLSSLWTILTQGDKHTVLKIPRESQNSLEQPVGKPLSQ